LTFDEIRVLDAGIKKGGRFAGTKIPTLEEALDCLPWNIWINVHTSVSQPEEIAKLILEKSPVVFLAAVSGNDNQAFFTNFYNDK